MQNKWFIVDKQGLERILERRGGKQYAIFELVQNAWDENTTEVRVELEMLSGRPLALLRVIDDNPHGFMQLSDSFTLFAESSKKPNPQLRGRFNLGEKLVLACCMNATIRTTTGSVRFDEDGTRHTGRKRTDIGSVFEARIRMTRRQHNEVLEGVFRLIPPTNIRTFFNGQRIPNRGPVATFSARLQTEIPDEHGFLKRTARKAMVHVYKPHPGEKASIYELGIPVVETGDKYHVDVQQRVPVNLERDNVPPSYLQTLRTFILNNTFDTLTDNEAAEDWVSAASGVSAGVKMR